MGASTPRKSDLKSRTLKPRRQPSRLDEEGGLSKTAQPTGGGDEIEWQATFDAITDSVCIIDLDGRIIRANKATAGFFRLSLEELTGRFCFDLIHGLSASPPDCPLKRMKNSGRRETTIINRDGQWLQVTVDPIFRDGAMRAAVHVVSDITEPTVREKELHAREGLIRSITDHLPAYITCVGAKDLRYRFVNRAFAEAFSSTPDEMTGKRVREILGPERYALAKPYLEKARSGRHVTYEAVFTLGGEERWIKVDYVPQVDEEGRVTAITVLGYDLTEVKEAEQKARDLAKFPAENPNPVLRVAGDGALLYANDASMIVLDDWLAGIGLPVPDVLRGAVGRALETGRGHAVDVEFRERIFSFFVAPVTAQGYANVYGLDITERARAEEALSKSEERYREIFETAPVCIWEEDFSGVKALVDRLKEEGVTDFDGYMADHPEVIDEAVSLVKVVDINVQSMRFFGARSKETIRKNPTRVFLPETAAIFKDKIAAIAGGREFVEVETKVRTLKGHEKDILMVMKLPPRGSDFDRVLVCFLDITDRKDAERRKTEIERRILYVQKLESLGVLAGGIAHDFNNLLMVILGHADLALLGTGANGPAAGHLREIVNASRRASDLCRQMLAYSGKGAFVVEPLDLSALVDGLTHLIKTAVSKGTVLTMDLDRNLPAMEADPNEIRQVVMNLVINASEAIGEQPGAINVATGTEYCERDFLTAGFPADDLPEGTYVSLEVSDTGCGMDSRTLEHVFEPFFTTKFLGRGLGMSAVLGIVRGHKGTIRISSEVGKGTTIRVLFPASDTRAEKVAEAEKSRARGWEGRGTILLVDDDETVRSLGMQILTSLGFDVVTAADGREALSLYREKKGEFRCIMLDLTMPGIGGEETFRELRKIDLGQRSS